MFFLSWNGPMRYHYFGIDRQEFQKLHFSRVCIVCNVWQFFDSFMDLMDCWLWEMNTFLNGSTHIICSWISIILYRRVFSSCHWKIFIFRSQRVVLSLRLTLTQLRHGSWKYKTVFGNDSRRRRCQDTKIRKGAWAHRDIWTCPSK